MAYRVEDIGMDIRRRGHTYALVQRLSCRKVIIPAIFSFTDPGPVQFTRMLHTYYTCVRHAFAFCGG